VHTFGCPGPLSEILQIARRNRLFVIEDGCEALGAEYDGKKVGAHGDAGVFAFYPNKQITTGEGGVVVTSTPAVDEVARVLRNQGRSSPRNWFQHTELGYSYRISELNCALGLEQLKRIESILDQRESVAWKYHHRLSNHADLTTSAMAVPRRKISWFAYVVRLSPRFTRFQRDWIVKEMNSRGIGCGRYFAPIHLQPVYLPATGKPSELPVTEQVAERAIALPFFNQLQEGQIDTVCHSLIELIGQARDRKLES